MLAPLLLLWPLGVWLTWLMAQGIANAPFDRELGEMARILARQIVVTRAASGQASVRFDVPTRVSDILRSAEPDEVYFQVLGLRGELLSGDRDVPVPDASELAGPGELRFRHDRVNFDDVRIASLRINVDGASAPGPLVQVAQTLGRRSHLATEVVKGMVLVQFAILPLAVLLVWLALALGIEPLNRLQQRIRDRDSSDLSPIDALDAPEEVHRWCTPSTTCWPGSTHLWARKSTSWPTQRTNSRRHWPGCARRPSSPLARSTPASATRWC